MTIKSYMTKLAVTCMMTTSFSSFIFNKYKEKYKKRYKYTQRKQKTPSREFYNLNYLKGTRNAGAAT